MLFIVLLAWILIGILGIALAQWPLILAFAIIGSVGYALARRGGQPFQADPVYFASRLSHDNMIFPTQVAVLPNRIVRYKARFIGHNEESIGIAQIASVTIRTGLLWSNVTIESTGGQNQIVCHGHTNQDANAIQQAIETYQAAYSAGLHKTIAG
jgi:hypothetical protein